MMIYLDLDKEFLVTESQQLKKIIKLNTYQAKMAMVRLSFLIITLIKSSNDTRFYSKNPMNHFYDFPKSAISRFLQIIDLSNEFMELLPIAVKRVFVFTFSHSDYYFPILITKSKGLFKFF